MATLTLTAPSVDGDVQYYSYGTAEGDDYSLIRAGPGVAAALAPNNFRVGQTLHPSGGVGGQQGYRIWRGVLFFDTSALPDNAVISAAVLTLRVLSINTQDGDFDIHLVSGRDICSTPIATDYGRLFGARTSFSSVSTADMVEDADEDFTLNATGRATISLSGITQFGLRSSHDIEGVAPTVPDDTYTRNWVNFISVEHPTDPAPKLVITYTSATPSVNTDDASSITTTGATMNGTLVDDGGAACDCQFEWGRTTAYGNTTAAQSKTTGQTFLQALTGLLPNTLYHFRAIADGATGADKTFMTLAPVAGTAPTVVAGVVGGLRFYFGPGTYITEIGLGGYGRAFSTIPWGHYGAGDPEGQPDLTPAPDFDVCAMAAEAWNRYLIHESNPPTPGDPKARQQWEREKAHLWGTYVSLHAACSLARRLEGGATGVNK